MSVAPPSSPWRAPSRGAAPPSPARRSGGAAWVLLALAAPSLGAQTVPDLGVEWRWVDFGPESGLPAGGVHEVVHLDSVVWIATEHAAAWYDGFRWRTALADGEPLPEPVTSLAADSAGGVLVVAGGRIFRGGQEGLRPLATPGVGEVHRALPFEGGAVLLTTGGLEPTVWTLAAGRAEQVVGLPPLQSGAQAWVTGRGRIWVETEEGAFVRQGGAWVARDPLPPGRRVGGVVVEGARGGGYLYRGGSSADRAVFTFVGDDPPLRVPTEGDNTPLSADVSPDGLILVAYETGDIRARTGDGWASLTLPQGKRAGVRLVRFSPEGDLWVGTYGSLHLFRRSLTRWAVFRRPFPASSNRVNTILVDPDSVLWWGTGEGVFRHPLRGGRAEWHPRPAGLSARAVTGLAAGPDGAVWATSGSDFEGALRWQDGRWTRVGAGEGLDVGYAHRVQAGPDGTLWFSSLGGPDGRRGGLFGWKDGVLQDVLTAAGVRRHRVYGTAWGADGTQWVAMFDGLLGLRDGAVAAQVLDLDNRDGIASLFDVAVDPRGRPWVAYNPFLARGLAYLSDEGELVPVIPPGPDGVRKVWSLLFDEEGALWIGTEGGVLRHRDGVWARLDGTVGLPSVNVWPLALHPSSLLIGTKGGGLVYLRRDEMANPPPRVVIETALEQDGAVRVGYAALAFWGQQPADRIETRHRVDGGPWSPWSTGREALLTGLGAGPHAVEVQAKGLFGQLSEPTLATVAVPFPLWLRPVFLLPFTVLLGALVWVRAVAAHRARAHRAALALSEGRLRALVESAPEAIGILDMDAGRFIDANDHALELFGLERADLPSLDPFALVPETIKGIDDPRGHLAERMELAVGGRMQVLEWTVVNREGVAIPCELRLARLPSGGPLLLRVSVLDIRDRKMAEARRLELEEQLHQSQKLEAVGQLTGGIAHDFNNLLTVIRGNLELLQEGTELEGPDRDLVMGAMQAAERSARLTQRLLAFSRRQKLAPQRLDLADLVAELHHLLDRSLGESVDVVIQVPRDLWPVSLDRGQLENAIVNLALNSRDAMPRGGRIRIAAENVEAAALDEPLLADLERLDHVRLLVEDTGEGMSPEVAARAIEPFFTTKEVGKGTGLGLSMVYGFVTQSGGTVRIDSRPGSGTTVSLYLPRDGAVPPRGGAGGEGRS